MTIRFSHFYALVFVVFSATSIWSKPIEVRSGEHGDFTRLVVYLPDNRDWSVSSEEDIFTFTAQGWSEGYDISEVYKLITNARVRSLVASDQKLVISLGCACEVEPFELENGFVGLDISGVDLDPGQDQSETANPVDAAEIASAVVMPNTSQPRVPWPVVFPYPAEHNAEGTFPGSGHKLLTQKFLRALSEEIAIGASQNLLQPNSTILPISNAPKLQKDTNKQSELLAELAKRSNFKSATERNNVEYPTIEPSCLHPKIYEISKWATDESFSHQLSILRSELYFEFDTLDEVVLMQLIRFFITYDLLPEAALALQKSESIQNNNKIKELLEGLNSNPETDDMMRGIRACEGETGFWAVVISGNSHAVPKERVEKLVSEFQRLPLRLKFFVADRFIKLLSSQGYDTASQVVKNSLTRYVQDPENQKVKIFSDIELAELSQQELFSLVEANDEKSPQALLAYLEGALNARERVAEEISELTSSYVKQLAGGDISRRLKTLNVKAMVTSDNVSQAFVQLFDEPGDELFNVGNLLEFVGENVLSQSSVKEVAVFVLKSRQSTLLEKLSLQLRLDVAEFLQDHGQPELSMAALEGLDEHPALTRIETRNDILSGENARALATIDALPSVELSRELSEFVFYQNADLAWEMRKNLSDVSAADIAWATQIWSQVQSDGPRAALALHLAQREPAADVIERPIRFSEEASRASKEARRLLRELLTENAL